MPSDVTIDSIFTESSSNRAEIFDLLLLAAARKPEGTSVLESKSPPLPAPEQSAPSFWNLWNILSPSNTETTHHTYNIAELLENGAQVNYLGYGKETPLMAAAKIGSATNATALCNAGANVHLVDDDNHSALTIACENNHTDVALFLINRGADVNHSYSFGSLSFSPLSFAIQNKNTSLCEVLIAGGANLETINTINTPNGTVKVNALGNALTHDMQDTAQAIVDKLIADNQVIKLDRKSEKCYSDEQPTWFKTMLNNSGAVIALNPSQIVRNTTAATADMVTNPLLAAAVVTAPAATASEVTASLVDNSRSNGNLTDGRNH